MVGECLETPSQGSLHDVRDQAVEVPLLLPVFAAGAVATLPARLSRSRLNHHLGEPPSDLGLAHLLIPQAESGDKAGVDHSRLDELEQDKLAFLNDAVPVKVGLREVFFGE